MLPIKNEKCIKYKTSKKFHQDKPKQKKKKLWWKYKFKIIWKWLSKYTNFRIDTCLFTNIYSELYSTVSYWIWSEGRKSLKKISMWRHKNEGLSISFFGVFFPISPLILLIFMTSHGWFLTHFGLCRNWTDKHEC